MLTPHEKLARLAGPVLAILCVCIAFILAPKDRSTVINQPAATPPLEKVNNPSLLFGFIRSVRMDNGTTIIAFDAAEWFTNDDRAEIGPGAADLAAAEDGRCDLAVRDATTNDCAPNGFYIRNNSASTTTLLIPASARIALIAFDAHGSPSVQQTVSPKLFSDVFAHPSNYTERFYTATQNPYMIRVVNGIVTEVVSQYLP